MKPSTLMLDILVMLNIYMFDSIEFISSDTFLEASQGLGIFMALTYEDFSHFQLIRLDPKSLWLDS